MENCSQYNQVLIIMYIYIYNKVLSYVATTLITTLLPYIMYNKNQQIELVANSII